MSHPPLDPITIGIAAASLVVGAGAAQYAGPYLVIFLGALMGSMIALRRRAPGPRMHAVVFVFVMVLWAMLITIPVAEATAAFLAKDWRWLVGPVAVGVAALGEGWASVGQKIHGIYISALEKMRT